MDNNWPSDQKNHIKNLYCLLFTDKEINDPSAFTDEFIEYHVNVAHTLDERYRQPSRCFEVIMMQTPSH